MERLWFKRLDSSNSRHVHGGNYKLIGFPNFGNSCFPGSLFFLVSLFSVFILVFEEAFSVYDVRGSGKIPKKRFFELLRTLGYNIHKAEAYEYMNELELAGIGYRMYIHHLKFDWDTQ